MNFRHRPSNRRDAQAGQSFVLVVILIALFLVGAIGVATDYTQVWAHRQMVQAAADAACQAGVADMYLYYQCNQALSGSTCTSQTVNGVSIDYSWIPSTAGIGAFNCSTNPNSPVCKYASFNGYSGSNISVTFPTSVANVAAIPASLNVTTPYIKVAITDPVSLTFSAAVTPTVNVTANATCGLGPISVPLSIVVLHPTSTKALATSGNPTIKIYSGPNRVIQVNSTNASAVYAGGTSSIDLTQAGPNNTGADLGVSASEAKLANVSLGTTGTWVANALPYADPWAAVVAPSKPTYTGGVQLVAYKTDGCPDPTGCAEFSPGDYTGCKNNGKLSAGDNGCAEVPLKYTLPAITGLDWTANTTYAQSALVYVKVTSSSFSTFIALNAGTSGGNSNKNNFKAASAGTDISCSDGTGKVSDGTITWCDLGGNGAASTAIFQPGLYYMGSTGLLLDSNSTVRPAVQATATCPSLTKSICSDGSYGTTFYFSSTGNCSSSNGTLCVSSNSGNVTTCSSTTSSNCVDSYLPGTTSSNSTDTLGVTSPALQCANGPSNPSQISAFEDSNGGVSGNVLLGPCTGTYDATGGGLYGTAGQGGRGFLFFQSRSTSSTATWGGGGQSIAAGFIYFHQTTTYGSNITLQGGSGQGALAIGNIVSDTLTLGGNSGITMVLNTAPSYTQIPPSLLQ